MQRGRLAERHRRMTTTEIARRVQARPSGGAFLARCPAHDDRSPSLSIREGRDGRVLLRCHAGCEIEAIVHALGLAVHDLFEGQGRSRALPARRPASADEVESELQAALAAIVADESRTCGFEVATVARHRNRAREVVERRLSVRLKREATPWFELEPHCVDPTWSACIDQAISLAAARLGLQMSTLCDALADLPRLQRRVLAEARGLQKSITCTS